MTKRYGSVTAISDLSLTVEKGSFTALLGPSGCGKSTLLRMIAGLEQITSGQCFIDTVDVTDVPPAQTAHRDGVPVLRALPAHDGQAEHRLFPVGRRGRREKFRTSARSKWRASCSSSPISIAAPPRLSGGQRQRVAIGRALVRKPEVFLFDEPLSNLDAKLRVQMRLELARLHADLGTTMIYVTHDQTEAMTLADRIVVLDKGTISQVGSPLDLYNAPANKFVASFIGSPSMNVFSVEVTSVEGRRAAVALPGGRTARVRVGASPADAGEVELGVRPEHLSIVDTQHARAALNGVVAIVERLGNSTLLYVDTPAGQVIVEGEGNVEARIGEPVGLTIDEAHAHLFGAAGATL